MGALQITFSTGDPDCVVNQFKTIVARDKATDSAYGLVKVRTAVFLISEDQ